MHYGSSGCGCAGYGQMYYDYPQFGYGVGYGNWFALIVVLFILLIIIGASCYRRY